MAYGLQMSNLYWSKAYVENRKLYCQLMLYFSICKSTCVLRHGCL